MTTFSTDPALYIFTSLTAGSSHIVTATSRLETILRANRVPFKAVDIATDQKARMLWGRRAGKDESGRVRKLPAIVQESLVLGDLVEIEDWNEYGELKQHVKIYYDEHTIPSIHNKPPEPLLRKRPAKPAAVAAAGAAGVAAAAAAAASSASSSPPAPPPAPPLPEAKTSSVPASKESKPKDDKPTPGKSTTLPIRSVADEAAQKAKELRLKSLREKVHGKAGAAALAEKAKEETPKEDKAKEEKPEGKAVSAVSDSAGLQSPTRGTWKNDSEADAAQNSLQSPTSARWKSSPGPVQGAQVAEAGAKEVKTGEATTVIKEDPKLDKKGGKEEKKEESESEEESDEDESEEEEESEDDKKKEEDEEEDDDDEDDDDDDDDDDDEEEESEEDDKKKSK